MVAFKISSAAGPLPDNNSSEESAARIAARHDATLVRRFKNGDEAAFTEIVARHHAKVLALAVARLGNHADAEEIAQDTFIRAHRALADFRGESSLATWLHRITVNLALNRYWYFFRRRRHMSQSLDSALVEGGTATLADVVASDAPGPVREVITTEFAELVAVCITRLSPAQNEILRLRTVLDHSYEEIAVTLGINVGTVKSRIARARQNLHAQLAELCPEFDSRAASAEWFGRSGLA